MGIASVKQRQKGVEAHHIHEQVAVRLTRQDIRTIDQLVASGFFLNRSDFLRSAARDKLQQVEVLDLRQVSRKQAQKEILDHLRRRPGTYPSDIAHELRLDLRLVMEVCRELLDDGDVEEGAA